MRVESVMVRLNNHVKKVLIMVAAFGLLTACATVNQSNRTDEDVVAEKSQKRLNALLEGDIEAALTYATPVYRDLVTLDRYIPRVIGSSRWEKAEVGDVVCEEDVCNVKALVTYSAPRFKMTNTTVIPEKWIRIEGEWWIYHEMR